MEAHERRGHLFLAAIKNFELPTFERKYLAWYWGVFPAYIYLLENTSVKFNYRFNVNLHLGKLEHP